MRLCLQQLTRLLCAPLSNAFVQNSLPYHWGEMNAFPKLTTMHMGNNMLKGSLPVQYGTTGLLNLTTLNLAGNKCATPRWLHAGLPCAAPDPGVLLSLQGPLPENWTTRCPAPTRPWPALLGHGRGDVPELQACAATPW